MLIWISRELPIKIENKYIKYIIMKWAIVIKMFWNKYGQKNWTEERT